MNCPVCLAANLVEVDSETIYKCSECEHWFSTLTPKINTDTDKSISLDVLVKEALSDARKDIFHQSFELLKLSQKLNDKTHLDVGCSIGQFLQVSAEYGMRAVGIEPEESFMKIARENGLEVKPGYFPDVLTADDQYTLISFMDVLGHIPDARRTIEDALHHLTEDGVIMIKTPVADGVFFKIGYFLRKLSFNSLWRRLFQVDFASPQIHFFTKKSLMKLAELVDCQIIATKEIPAIRLKGLWRRLLPGERMPYWKAVPVYMLLLLLMPVFHILPKDSMLVLLSPAQKITRV